MATDASSSPRALVTGASRGIGKAIAVALARAGFDVAVTARTQREGDGQVAANLDDPEAPRLAVTGSLAATAAAVEAEGRRCLPIPMNLGDGASVTAAAATMLHEWGAPDVLVMNAVSETPGSQAPVVDLDLEVLREILETNMVQQIGFLQGLLPAMAERGRGTVINLTSASAHNDPLAPAAQGGWGIGYSASKAAFYRVAGGINAELGAKGVVAYNLDPGTVATEAQEARGYVEKYRAMGATVDPPEVPAAAAVWLATSADARAMLGRRVIARKLVAEHGLVEGY